MAVVSPMASSKGTQPSYALCCEQASIRWQTKELRYSTNLHGWLFPCPSSILARSPTWHFCPFCGKDLPPFEPTQPWSPETDGD